MVPVRPLCLMESKCLRSPYGGVFLQVQFSWVLRLALLWCLYGDFLPVAMGDIPWLWSPLILFRCCCSMDLLEDFCFALENFLFPGRRYSCQLRFMLRCRWQPVILRENG